MITYKCTKCGHIKDEECFDTDKRLKTRNKRSICKSCRSLDYAIKTGKSVKVCTGCNSKSYVKGMFCNKCLKELGWRYCKICKTDSFKINFPKTNAICNRH